MLRFTSAMLSCLAALGAAPPASADLLATATWVGTIGGSSPTLFPLPLGQNGRTSLSFATASPHEKVRITYSAQCGVAGTTQNHFNALVMVDGELANPATSDFALCTGVVADYVISGATRQVIFVVPRPGNHTVQVMGALVGTGNGVGFSVGNSSIVVDN